MDLPNVTGLTIPAATQTLKAAGYAVASVSFSPSATQPLGFALLATSTVAGSAALVVSSGPPAPGVRFDFTQVMISQYASSPIIGQLVANMNAYVNPWADFQAFYSYVWNVYTAQGFGLDILGRIVSVTRYLQLPSRPLTFGFYNGTNPPDFAPLGQAPFAGNGQATSTYAMTDAVYRIAILAKALANISAATVPALNQLLRNLFGASGQCYVIDPGNMTISYAFRFALSPVQYAILTQSNVISRPAGVQVNILQIVASSGNFGFYGTGYQPLGQGPFLA